MRGKHEYGNDTGEYDGITPAHAGKTPIGALRTSTSGDHPRACGENRVLRLCAKVNAESPPRMRGKRSPVLSYSCQRGITPAHAGKTSFGRRASCRLWDHPRACGENIVENRANEIVSGSPPRMRGKLVSVSIEVLKGGITPAHAGKTQYPNRQRQSAWDHPRACGENSIGYPCSGFTSGSPPRMRGKLAVYLHGVDAAGITPAHAGKTRAVRVKSPRRLGSPPRMRGKLYSHRLPANHRGITPAHAGKTLSRPGTPTEGRDHPRACGENRSGYSTPRKHRGSPPRMRGKLLSQSPAALRAGITPAHAGKTSKKQITCLASRDHPRACGENHFSHQEIPLELGSPPRMRGKRKRVDAGVPIPGITPAHAGKTLGQ